MVSLVPDQSQPLMPSSLPFFSNWAKRAIFGVFRPWIKKVWWAFCFSELRLHPALFQSSVTPSFADVRCMLVYSASDGAHDVYGLVLLLGTSASLISIPSSCFSTCQTSEQPLLDPASGGRNLTAKETGDLRCRCFRSWWYGW